jgi:hypothetical protein
MAETWIDLAKSLVAESMKAEAQKALDEARAASSDHAGIAAAQGAVDAIAQDVPATPAATTRWKKTAAEVDKLWEKMAEAHGGAWDEPLSAEGWARAVDLDPTKPRVAKQAAAAKDGIALLKAPGHPMMAWLALPNGWKPGKQYPVLVTVEGAGANFVNNALGFRNLRGSRDVILLTPWALSSTNALEIGKFPAYGKPLLETHADQGKRLSFDVDGLERLLDVVQARFGGAPKAAITGFSGGGLLAYSFTMRKPARVMLAAPACPNFSPISVQGASKVEGGGPPVRIFTGADDEYRESVGGERGIEHQTDRAIEELKRLGFQDVQRSMLPGVGHSSCVLQVWLALDEILAAKK